MHAGLAVLAWAVVTFDCVRGGPPVLVIRVPDAAVCEHVAARLYGIQEADDGPGSQKTVCMEDPVGADASKPCHGEWGWGP